MRFPNPPRGIKAIPWRMPIWIFKLGFGWLFGDRALLLSHTGRKTGEKRHTVLEIVQKSSDNQSYTVVSGFGPKSHWYKNISHNPKVNIQVGMNKIDVVAHQLDSKEKEKIFLEYVNKYPQGFKFLANLVGYEIKHTHEGYQDFARQIPMIQFTPR